jgi:hypothetical protein
MIYSLAAIRKIEAAMPSRTVPEEVYLLIQSLTEKVGGNMPTKSVSMKENVTGLLNKLTTDTYAVITTKVCGLPLTESLVEDVFIFAYRNTFYSKLYARLVKDMVSVQTSLLPFIEAKYTAYLGEVKALTPEDKGKTLLLVLLALNGTVNVDLGIRIVTALQAFVEANLHNDESCTFPWVEHLTVALTQNKSFTASCNVEERIRAITEMDVKKTKGVSLKVVFKYMDILDHFK